MSVASVAAELARKIFGSLQGKTILLVGAGKMSDLTARHLIQQGATTLLVSNRTEARAERIADTLRNPAITTGVIPFDQLHSQAHRADIIVTSTGASGSSGHIFSPEHARAMLQRRRNRPIFFIDIAVPRDVAPSVNDLEGCFVYDIDDLQEVAVENRTTRSQAAESAESIVVAEAQRYSERLAQAPAIEAIRQLQQNAESLRETELARTAQRLAATPAYAALPRGAVHGDLFRDNVMFQGTALTGVFDFYFAGVDAFLFDIAVALNDWCIDLESGRLDEDRADALVTGYESVRLLEGAELRLLPALMRAAAFRFWLSRSWDLHLPRDAVVLQAHDPDHFERVLLQRRESPWHAARARPPA